MATLLIRMPDGAAREEALAGEVTVGRSDGNTVVLTEGGVSRRHARFFEQDGKVMVEDLGSANGTFVDGEQVAGATELGPRAQVVIGDYEISVKAGAPRRKSGPGAGAAPADLSAPIARSPGGVEDRRGTAQVPAARPARATRQLSAVERQKVPGEGAALARRTPARAAAEPTGPSLRGLTGPWANKLYPLRGTVVVGRVAGLQIQVEDESVSRRHAELERTADGVVVRDLGSANGTTVNGQPLEGDTLLQPGDQVQFGMIEFVYELGDEAALAAPTRRGGAPAGRRSAGPAGAGAAAGSRRMLIIAGAAVVLLLSAGVVAKVAGGDGGGGAGGTSGGNGGALLPPDPKAEVERLLAECRSFAATDLGTQPNWERARAACEKARELDPINRTVIDLVQKVDREQECQARYEAGRRLMNLLREEEALEEFARIDEKCSYYRVVKPQARDAIDKVRKKAGEDCKTYASMQRWEQAMPRCEKFMTIACQKMDPELLNPPVGYEVDLVGGCRRKKNCWTPRDPMHRNLLLSRAKLDAESGPWMCPPIKMFDDDLELTDPRAEVRKAFRSWHQEKLMVEAMELYWEGKGGESLAKLQRLRSDRAKATLHQAADDLRRDVAAVENLYRVGSTLLRERDFEKARDSFKDALDLDAKLMRDLVEKKSFYRSTIEVEMAKESYLGGKHWADRSDHRRACRIWKLGFYFFRGNGDINRAVGFCSGRGGQALAQARNCADLAIVLDFAVDGDGLKDKVAEKSTELGCPN
jgi:pSer/pThr/pTyr-binding forkhead associated (FHA) protein/tetratricopeptide (TPR) repeat protein